MISPNFLIIGAQKCGTTSIYHYLNQHPEVFLPSVKEPEYFTFNPEKTVILENIPKLKKICITDFNDYIALFQDATTETAIGEASPTYLYGSTTCKRIKEKFPDIKHIAVLRNPTKRAFSHFQHNTNRGIEPINSFEMAISAESKRINNGWPLHWHYLENGFYHKHLMNYYKTFPKKNIKIIIFEEFISDPQKSLEEICRFLGVHSDFVFDTNLKYAISGKPVLKSLNWLLLKPNFFKRHLRGVLPVGLTRKLKYMYSQKLLIKQKIDPSTERNIAKLYKDDINNLSLLLNKDLSIWDTSL